MAPPGVAAPPTTLNPTDFCRPFAVDGFTGGGLPGSLVLAVRKHFAKEPPDEVADAYRERKCQ